MKILTKYALNVKMVYELAKMNHQMDQAYGKKL